VISLAAATPLNCIAQATAPDLVREEIVFYHGEDRLSGTLVRPSSGRHPAVVTILGSGAQDREYGGDVPALAENFAKHGIACLSWDKPGVGKSTGDFNRQSFKDRADEALAAINYLRQRKDIVPDKIGIWGHSQGGMIAPLAASLSENVAFLIEVGGWQGPAWRQDIVRVEMEMRGANCSEADIREAVVFATMRMEMMRGKAPFEEFDRKQMAVASKSWFDPYIHYCPADLFYVSRPILNHNLASSWSKVRCPVLVIYGECDRSSGNPKPLIALITAGLARARNKNLTVRLFPMADHSLHPVPPERQPRQSGADKPTTEQKPEGEKRFVPGYLELLVEWLNKHIVSPASPVLPDSR